MSDPVVTDVKADVSKVEVKFKDLWAHWGTYFIAAVCLIIGGIVLRRRRR